MNLACPHHPSTWVQATHAAPHQDGGNGGFQARAAGRGWLLDSLWEITFLGASLSHLISPRTKRAASLQQCHQDYVSSPTESPGSACSTPVGHCSLGFGDRFADLL